MLDFFINLWNLLILLLMLVSVVACNYCVVRSVSFIGKSISILAQLNGEVCHQQNVVDKEYREMTRKNIDDLIHTESELLKALADPVLKKYYSEGYKVETGTIQGANKEKVCVMLTKGSDNVTDEK